MGIAKVLNLINFAVAFCIGVYCTGWPNVAAEGLGISFSAASGLTDFRATYGGLCLAFALFWWQAARAQVGMAEALLLGVYFYGGLAFVRAYGIVFDGSQPKWMFIFLVIEMVMAVFSFRAYGSLKRLDR